MNNKRLKIIGIVLGSIFVLLPTFYVCSWTLYFLGFRGEPPQITESIYQADQSDPLDVTDAFIFSLADNRTEEMKKFVLEKHWDFLDEWRKSGVRSLKECQFYSDPDYGGISVVGDVSKNETRVGSTNWIDCLDGGKTLKAYIYLTRIEDKWFVSDWENLEIE